MWYNIFGTINTLFIFVSLYGVYLQLSKLWLRKENGKEKVTDVLSQNQFTMSFLAYFSFFVYGYSIDIFNHYIVWPRLIASILVILILVEMWKDRKSKASVTSLVLVSVSFTLGIIGLALNESFADHSKQVSTILIMIITLLLAQGYTHQIKLIISSGKTGAIDIRMSQFILMMDISTIAFAMTMGLAQGWPLIVLATVSAITKLIIMYLFHWARVSPVAKNRSEYG
ncbi:hypothetical protein [Colwellia psychrerythraea]|uniref:Putative membrane protein n=1 Tax=Colwellia psychrerythraea (strain 34H / ATCC BAA-681) TaxID=167879 RepID=Q482Y3_COLP3|nr:hypothetical protein [Colwellia psychrerythraea]AAZ24016.1 putative membrane protein [Colwellia psychrerythraea 34H]